jgi:hypothetical protein
VLLFPIGAIGMRVGGNMNVHRAIQMLSLIALLVGFGLGIKLAQMRNYVCPFILPLPSLCLVAVGPHSPIFVPLAPRGGALGREGERHTISHWH